MRAPPSRPCRRRCLCFGEACMPVQRLRDETFTPTIARHLSATLPRRNPPGPRARPLLRGQRRPHSSAGFVQLPRSDGLRGSLTTARACPRTTSSGSEQLIPATRTWWNSFPAESPVVVFGGYGGTLATFLRSDLSRDIRRRTGRVRDRLLRPSYRNVTENTWADRVAHSYGSQ